MTVVMLIGIAPVAGLVSLRPAAENKYTNGDYVKFGSYPQSKVDDESLISELDKIDKNWISYGYYSGPAFIDESIEDRLPSWANSIGDYDGFEPISKKTDYMFYCDIYYLGEKYRAVYFNEYRPYLTYAQYSYNHQQENGYFTNKIYYFKYEPLIWHIEDVENGIISSYLSIDAQPFCNTISERKHDSSIYECSYLNNWLNINFYNTAFSANDQDQIIDNLWNYKNSYNSNPLNTNSFVFYSPQSAGATDYVACQGAKYGIRDGNVGYPKRTIDMPIIYLYQYNKEQEYRLSDTPFQSYESSIPYFMSVYHELYLMGIAPTIKVADINSLTPLMKEDYVYFGSYPQSEVEDTSLVAKLNSTNTPWISYNYYSGTGQSDGNMKPSDFMKYRDVIIDGIKYRGVTYSHYRPTNTFDPLVVNKDAKIYWFKFEPIRWRVLDMKDGLVFCDSIIDAQPYNNYIIRINNKYYGDKDGIYEIGDYWNSSIRKWLNEDFYNTAFTTEEQDNIKETSFSQIDQQTDKIFNLSSNDTVNTDYGFLPILQNSAYNLSKAYISSVSHYAYIQGVGNIAYNDNDTVFGYGLRDGYNSYNHVPGYWMCAYDDDYFHLFNKGFSCCSTELGVRPALRVDDLDSLPSDDESVEQSLSISLSVKEYSHYVIDNKLYTGNGDTIDSVEATLTVTNDTKKEGSNSTVENIKADLTNTKGFKISGSSTINIGSLAYGESKAVKVYLTPDWTCDFKNDPDVKLQKLTAQVTSSAETVSANADYGVNYLEKNLKAELKFESDDYKYLDNQLYKKDGTKIDYIIAKLTLTNCFKEGLIPEFKNYLKNNLEVNNINLSSKLASDNGLSFSAASEQLLLTKSIDSIRFGETKTIEIKVYVTKNYHTIHQGESLKVFLDTDIQFNKAESVQTYTFIHYLTMPFGYSFATDKFGFQNPNTTIEKEIYQKMYGTKKGKELYNTHENNPHGVCYGMASVTAMAYSHNDIINMNRLSSIKSYSDCEKYFYSNQVTLKNFVEYGYIRQFAPEVEKQERKNTDDLQGLYNAVKKYVKGEGQPIIINITKSGQTNPLNFLKLDQHSIYAVGVQEDKEKITVLINDSNTPLTLQRLIISRDFKNWSYETEFYEYNSSLKKAAINYNNPGDNLYRYLTSSQIDCLAQKNNLVVSSAPFVANENMNRINSYDTNDDNNSEYYDYWMDESVKKVTISTDEENIISISDNNSSVTALLSSGTKADFVVDDNANNSVTFNSKKGDTVSVTFSTANGDTIVDCKIEGISVGSKVNAKETNGGIEIDGVSEGTVSVAVNDETVSEKEIINSTGAVSINYDNTGADKDIQISYNSGKVQKVSVDDLKLNYKKSATLNPTITADVGVKYTVKYESSNPKVATVDQNGKVTATKRGSGSATITCTVTDEYGNVVKDTCKVDVKLSFGQWLIVILLFGWIWY